MTCERFHKHNRSIRIDLPISVAAKARDCLAATVRDGVVYLYAAQDCVYRWVPGFQYRFVEGLCVLLILGRCLVLVCLVVRRTAVF